MYNDVVEIFSDVSKGEKVFVLDTSAIYNMHFLTKKNFENVVKEIQKISNSIYLIPQVNYELRKNAGNKSIIGQIKGRKYNFDKPIKELGDKLKIVNKDVENIDRFYGSSLNEVTEDLKDLIKNMIDSYDDYIKKRKEVIDNIPSIDFSENFKKTNIPDFVNGLSIFNPKWTTQKLYDLKLEFSENIKNSNKNFFGKGDAFIKDSKKKNHNIEGDFYIFKEMIDLSVDKDVDVIFVTSDIEKNDMIDPDTKCVYTDITDDFNNATSHSLDIISTRDFINGILFSENEFITTLVSEFIEEVDWSEIFSRGNNFINPEVDFYDLESKFINDFYNIDFDCFQSLDDIEIEKYDFFDYTNFEVVDDEIILSFIFDVELKAYVTSGIVFSSKEDPLPGGKYEAKVIFKDEIDLTFKIMDFAGLPADSNDANKEDIIEHFASIVEKLRIDHYITDFPEIEVEYGENLENHYHEDFDMGFTPGSDWNPTGVQCSYCGYEIYIENDGGGGYHTHCRDEIDD